MDGLDQTLTNKYIVFQYLLDNLVLYMGESFYIIILCLSFQLILFVCVCLHPAVGNSFIGVTNRLFRNSYTAITYVRNDKLFDVDIVVVVFFL